MLRRRLDALLPIDVLTTHYPDRRGRVLLNVALPHTADQALRQAAPPRDSGPRTCCAAA
jgi:hypothetical protein